VIRSWLKVYGMKPRIYVILRGGLGNQLHQIASGVAISERVGGVVRIYSHIVDTAVNPSRRGYFRELNLSNVFYAANLAEVNWLEDLVLRVLVLLKSLGTNKSNITEDSFDQFNPYLKFYFVKGWFQSHKYLPKRFDPSALGGQLDLEESAVTIHIRLTDFSLIDSEPLNSDYYSAAVAQIKILDSSVRFVCFSDDIARAQEILVGMENGTFPEVDCPLTPDKLLVKMSSTKYLICSRSSISWWAAQIVSANGGHVISPWVGDVGNDAWSKIQI